MRAILRPDIDWRIVPQKLFGVKPYDYEVRIFNSVFNKHSRRVTIRATTRAGKSYTIAQIAILAAVLRKGQRVGVIGPTYNKTRIIMNYIADMLASNPDFDDIVMLDITDMNRLERLRKEVSKKRITFHNGASIECLSVDLDSRGFGAMGHAYDLILPDETDMIDDESYAKIYRMLVESPDSQIVEIGNPWQLAHFYNHHHDDSWDKIHIRWQDCVAAGRMTLEDVEDQRKNLTELEFRVLFDAEFPDELENAVFSRDAINSMITPRSQPRYDRVVIGVDVARGGRDRTVITAFGILEGLADYLEHQPMDTRDVMLVAGATAVMAEKYKTKKYRVEISVDTVGLGAGVKDRLTELNYDSHEFVAGASARQTDRFYNSKAEVAFRVAEASKAGLIRNIPPDSKYVLQLRAWTFKVRSDRQLQIIDPEDKSPDECFPAGTKVLTESGYKNIEDIKIGESIITPYGTRKVTNIGGREATTLESLEFSNGARLLCTGNHKVFANDGFINADSITVSARVSTDALPELLKWRLKKLLNLKGANIGFRKQIQSITTPTSTTEPGKSEERSEHCITTSTKKALEQKSRSDTLFTTLTETASIILLKTSLLLNGESIPGCTCERNMKTPNSGPETQSISKKQSQPLRDGTSPEQERHGIKITGLNRLASTLSQLKRFADNAARHMSESRNGGIFATSIVGRNSIALGKKIRVYNLTVEQDNVYYANGILVSNCDSLLIALARFIYHDDAMPVSHEAMNRPLWTKERPRNLLRPRG